MTVAVLALRGAVAIAVLTTLAGGLPRIVQAALAVTVGLWSAWVVLPLRTVDASAAAIAHEVVAGASLGLVAALPLLAVQTAGRLVDVPAGGRTYGALFGILAAAVFVGVDGHVAVLAAIVDSHRHAAEPGVTAAIAQLVTVAVRLAVPWLVTAAVVELAIGAGVRLAGRVGASVPAAAAVPAALVMMTASLVATLAVAIAHVVRA